MSSSLSSAKLPEYSLPNNMEGPASVQVFPEVTDPSQPLEHPELMDLMKGLDPGEFILDRRSLPGLSEHVTDAEFIKMPELGEGRRNSRHGVEFGKLIIRAADDGERSMLVAIKPFNNHQYEKAAHEYAATSLIASGRWTGFHTFPTVGVLNIEDLDFPANVTAYHAPVHTMDGIFWNKKIMQNSDVVDHNLGRAAVAMKTEHEILAHLDASVRNMPVNVMLSPEEVFVNDLETVRFLEHLSHDEQDKLRRKDIRQFADSLFLPVHEVKRDRFDLPDDYMDRILQNFAVTYVGTRQGRGDGHSLTFDDIAKIIERARAKAYKKAAKLATKEAGQATAEDA